MNSYNVSQKGIGLWWPLLWVYPPSWVPGGSDLSTILGIFKNHPKSRGVNNSLQQLDFDPNSMFFVLTAKALPRPCHSTVISSITVKLSMTLKWSSTWTFVHDISWTLDGIYVSLSDFLQVSLYHHLMNLYNASQKGVCLWWPLLWVYPYAWVSGGWAEKKGIPPVWIKIATMHTGCSIYNYLMNLYNASQKSYCNYWMQYLYLLMNFYNYHTWIQVFCTII